MMTKAVLSSVVTLGLVLVTAQAGASEVTVSDEWIRLGDVANVTGPAAQKPIAAAPPPGQRMPLAAEFVEMQSSAAGFPIDLPAGDMIWVTRQSETEDVYQPAPAPASKAEAYPDDVNGLVPMLNTDLRRGDLITADMITMAEPDPRRRIQGLIRSARHLVDTEATRTIRAGQPLSLNDIKAASVIRKDDPIQLIFETGALRLTVSAKALNDAAKGETVRVVNLQSRRTMDAVAHAPGEARVGQAGL